MEKFFAFLRPTPWNENGKIKESYLRYESDPDKVGGQYNGYVAVRKDTKFYKLTGLACNKAMVEGEDLWCFYNYTPRVSEELTFGDFFVPNMLEGASLITELPEIDVKIRKGLNGVLFLSDWYVFGFDTGHTYNRWSVDDLPTVREKTLELLEGIKSYED